jgi:predicted exporter
MTNESAPRSLRARYAGAVVFLAVLGSFVATRFEVTADITHFLPDVDDRALSALSREITDSELSRTMILAIVTPNLETSLRASRALEEALLQDTQFREALAFFEAGPALEIDRAIFELYEPRRLSFLATTPELAKARLTEEGLRAAARSLREELASPLSILASRVAPRDPFLTLPALFRRLETSRGSGLTIMDGRFVTEDGLTAILFLGTKASALDAAAQAPLLRAINEAFADVAASIPETIRLDQSGVNRMATRTAETIEADIKRVSTISILVLIGLLLLLFRSLRFVALAAIPVVFGILAGSASVLFVFGRLHGITLAFGASLIGVSIDYVVHFYCHHSIVSPKGGPSASLEAIKWPLATGAVTTTAGFLALGASNLSGLREIACFTVVGLLSAFLATVILVPGLVPTSHSQVKARARWVTWVESSFASLGEHRRMLALLPLGAVAIIAWGLPQANWNPDIASLSRLDPEILAEDERVRAKVMRFEQMRFVVALGQNDAEALETNDLIASALDAAIDAGELVAQRNVASLLPSPKTQTLVANVARNDPGLPNRLRRVFGEEGFAPAAFEPFLDSLTQEHPTTLDFDAILDSPAAALVRPFRVHLGDRVGILTFLHGVEDSATIADRLEEIPSAVFLRQSDLWSDAQLSYQQSTAELLAGGGVAVFLLLIIRYREPRRTLVSFLPSILAAGVTVSILSLLGRDLDLISLTALLFVVSMGVDYSVFLVDAFDESDPKSVAAALTGALLAGGSTIIAFGLLALSLHPVLSGLGLTAAVGIATSLALAPATLLLLNPKQKELSAAAREKERE